METQPTLDHEPYSANEDFSMRSAHLIFVSILITSVTVFKYEAHG